MTRRYVKIRCIVVMCIVGVFLAACGKENPELSDSQKAYTIASDESTDLATALNEDPYAEIKASREEIITIGSMAPKSWAQRPVDAFNQSQDKYWLEIMHYDSLDALLMDISRMQGPDIFYLLNVNADMMAQKGVLEDLTPYFENSEEVSKEKIVPAIWRAGSVGEGEYFVIPRFFSQFYLVEKGYTDNGVWTTGDFFALAEKYPEGMLHEYIKSPRDMLYNALDGSLDSYTCTYELVLSSTTGDTTTDHYHALFRGRTSDYAVGTIYYQSKPKDYTIIAGQSLTIKVAEAVSDTGATDDCSEEARLEGLC